MIESINAYQVSHEIAGLSIVGGLDQASFLSGSIVRLFKKDEPF
jgi:hypothetical protein